MKAVITISRYWDNPKIFTTISEDGINLQTDLDDFITALIQEIGSVTWVVTSPQFKKRVDKAVSTTLSKIKEESIKVV